MALHNDIGHEGEQMAKELMESKGYRILEQNWRLGHLEMDIICEKGDELVFVEVKTRTTTFGAMRPEQYVDERKRRFMVTAANAYMKAKNKADKSIRFDIIGILKPYWGKIELTHLENAFVPRVKTVTAGSYSGKWRWHNRYSAWSKRR